MFTPSSSSLSLSPSLFQLSVLPRDREIEREREGIGWRKWLLPVVEVTATKAKTVAAPLLLLCSLVTMPRPAAEGMLHWKIPLMGPLS